MTNLYVKKAITLLASVLACPEDSLSAEDTIETIPKWDSLNHMRLILQLEEELGCQIETDDAMTLFSVEQIADFLRKKEG